MEKLNFQDSAFLRLESQNHPFHVAGLVILKLPEDAPANYLSRLAARCGRLNELWPQLDKKLSHPDEPDKSGWVPEEDYQARRHVLHYALPASGTMADLMQLVTRAHERQLDRNRPLWEFHIIEGLPRNRFALYCKIHHALVDGAGALEMSRALLSPSPDKVIGLAEQRQVVQQHHERHGVLQELSDSGRKLMKQYKALPELSALLAGMGMAALRGSNDTMKLPYTAPRSIFNTEIDSNRQLIVTDLPLKKVKAMARTTGGSINDVLLAVCGGAIRRYLWENNALPRKSLVAGVPVAVKTAEKSGGNQLSFILCPYFTNERNALKRLRSVIRVTRSAKKKLAAVSETAAQDYTNLILMPTVLLTLTGNATRVNPAINAIFSNVPGSQEKLYLEGSEVEAIYPLSVVTAGMGLNLTVLSYSNKLCFAITSCPTEQPGIEKLGKYLKESFRELAEAISQEPS